MFRDGLIAGHTRSLRWFRVAVLGTAFAAILLVASGISLWHSDAPGSEATCPICHVAHMPVLPGTASGVLSAPKIVARVQQAAAQVSHSAPAGLDSPHAGRPPSRLQI